MKYWFSLLSVIVLSLAPAAIADDSAGVFRHVVLFKFKAETSAEQIAHVEAEFRKLPSEINSITSFEWGTSKTIEVELAHGYTHCFLVTFKDKAGLEAYLPHPAHQAFVALVKPLVEEVHVLDYVAEH
jgi:quinol monooxygenase YgiN